MPDRPRALLAFPSYLVGQVAKLAQQRLGAALAVERVRLPHLAVLAALDEAGPRSQQQLADELGIDKSSVVALVDELAARRLLRRDGDPDDRRRHRLALTAHGHELTRRLLTVAEACQRDLFGALSRGERAQLTALLRRVLDAHDAAAGSAAAPARSHPRPRARRVGAEAS